MVRFCRFDYCTGDVVLVGSARNGVDSSVVKRLSFSGYPEEVAVVE